MLSSLKKVPLRLNLILLIVLNMQQHLSGGLFEKTQLVNSKLPVHRDLQEITAPGNAIKMQCEFRMAENKFRDGATRRIDSIMPTRGNYQRSIVRKTLPIILFKGKCNMRPDMHFDLKGC